MQTPILDTIKSHPIEDLYPLLLHSGVGPLQTIGAYMAHYDFRPVRKLGIRTLGDFAANPAGARFIVKMTGAGPASLQPLKEYFSGLGLPLAWAEIKPLADDMTFSELLVQCYLQPATRHVAPLIGVVERLDKESGRLGKEDIRTLRDIRNTKWERLKELLSNIRPEGWSYFAQYLASLTPPLDNVWDLGELTPLPKPTQPRPSAKPEPPKSKNALAKEIFVETDLGAITARGRSMPIEDFLAALVEMKSFEFICVVPDSRKSIVNSLKGELQKRGCKTLGNFLESYGIIDNVDGLTADLASLVKKYLFDIKDDMALRMPQRRGVSGGHGL